MVLRYQNDGNCGPGCPVDINIDNIALNVPSDDVLRVDLQFGIDYNDDADQAIQVILKENGIFRVFIIRTLIRKKKKTYR